MPSGEWSEDAELALLAGRTRDGSESAFEELVRRVHGRVRKWARRLTEDHDEAEGLLSEDEAARLRRLVEAYYTELPKRQR